MKIRDVVAVIENFAPLSLQESYDNSGLIVGRLDDEVHAALLAVDVTEEVLDEAEREGCDLIIRLSSSRSSVLTQRVMSSVVSSELSARV